MSKRIKIKKLCRSILAVSITFTTLQASAALTPEAAPAIKESCLHSKISGSGDAVLLMPGFISDARVWNDVAAQLAKSYQVHQLSIAGFGGQGACQHANNIYQTIHNELKLYLANPSLIDPIYVGHSMGGLLGLELSIDNIKALKGVISVDGLPFIGAIFTGSNDTTVADLTAQATFFKTMYQTATPQKMVQMTQRGINIQTKDPQRQQLILEMAKQSDPKTAASAISAVMLTDLRTEISKTTTPTLIIGASGGFSTSQQKQQAQALYQAQLGQNDKLSLKMNTQARHFVMWDQQDWLVEAIKQFIKDNS